MQNEKCKLQNEGSFALRATAHGVCLLQSDDDAGEGDEVWVVAEGVEVGLDVDEVAEVGIDV